MNEELLPHIGKSREQVRIDVAQKQHRLKEENARRPHRSGSAQVGQKHLADHRLADEQKKSAEEDSRCEKTRSHEGENQPRKERTAFRQSVQSAATSIIDGTGQQG